MKHVSFECGPIFYKNNKNATVLNYIKLNFNSPHVAVITGPSGCGKTTLLKAVSGLIKAEVGIRKLNNTIYNDKNLVNWRNKVTFLPQDAPIVPGTVEENIIFPFKLKNCQHPLPRLEDVLEIFKKLNLKHITFNQDAASLSGGERHRLCLARGLIWKPYVLLADEPLSGLEQDLAQKCFEVLKEFSQTYSRIVICTLHNELLAKQADSLWRLKNGKLYRA